MIVSITGNLEIGRICIEGQNYLTVKIDKDGGPMLYENGRGIGEIQFCRPGESLEGRTRTSASGSITRAETTSS